MQIVFKVVISFTLSRVIISSANTMMSITTNKTGCIGNQVAESKVENIAVTMLQTSPNYPMS
jgi:hypothetical protein